MRVLTNTNIIIDDFDYCKNYPKGTFIHFLTHYHADHYQGLCMGWDYGPIYCSEITKRLILANFPDVQNITGCELNKKFTIFLNSEQTKSIQFTCFDANHIPGSVMILFQGYMGTILHTGDMRFVESMIQDNPILFPPEKRNKSNSKCSIPIDEVIFDNTYINPVHKFPNREKSIQMVIDIIEKNKGKEVLIVMGILGKERIALELANHFQTCVKIPQRKFMMMQAMGLPTDSMTTESGKSWIEVIHAHLREQRLEEEKMKGNDNFIMISVEFTVSDLESMTASDGVNYLVPYSQHSNYHELEIFVKSICPAILRKLVDPYFERPQFKSKPINNLAIYNGYMNKLTKGGKSAFKYFITNYTDFSKLSNEYKQWMTKQGQDQLKKELKIPITTDPELKRVANKKKKALEDELKKITKKDDVDVKVLADKYFPSQKVKRRSFADITAQKSAISNSQSLDLLFSKMGGKKNVTTNVPKVPAFTDSQKDKSNNTEMVVEEERRINAKPGKILDIEQVYKQKDSIKTRYRPSQDNELMMLMEIFMKKESEVDRMHEESVNNILNNNL